MALADILIHSIRKRLYEQNKNYLAVFVGETGSGKSYSALKIASTLDEDFDVDRVVIGRPLDFIRLCKKLHAEKVKGAFIVFDEAGIGMPAREWMTVQNKILSYVLQLFRKQNLGVIFTVPSMKLIDAHARILFHAIGHAHSIDYEKKCVNLLYYVVKHNPVFDTYELEPFIAYDTHGNPIQIDVIKIGLPPKDLIEEYEKKKDEFMSEFYGDIEEQLSNSGKTIDGRTLRSYKKKAEVLENYIKKRLKEGVSINELAREFSINPATLHGWIKEIKAEA